MVKKNDGPEKRKTKKETKKELKEKEELKEELREEVIEEVKEEITEDVKDELLDGARIMPKRKVSFWAEFKAFIIILAIIGLISLGGWYWYTHMKDHSVKEKDSEVKEKEIIGYDYKVLDKKDNDVKVVGDYIIFYKEDYVTKILSLSGNVLYEGNYKANRFALGFDKNLYLLDVQSADDANSIKVSKFDDNDIKEVYSVGVDNTYFQLIYYSDYEDNSYLVGLAGSEFVYEDGETKIEDTYFYDLKGNEDSFNGYMFSGDVAVLDVESDIHTYNDQYITFVDSNNKYGLYDYVNREVVIDSEYDGLYGTYNDNFIAVKDKKAGIINSKEKILVVFEYDFIDRQNGFYVIGKDDKLAIMNKDYEFVTGFDFKYHRGDGIEYTYKLCCTNFNTFAAIKLGDKYILATNVIIDEDDLDNSNDDTYLIDSNGESEAIKEDGFKVLDNYVYFFNKKENSYLFYDKDLEYRFTVDLSTYTFAKSFQDFYELGDYVYIFEKDLFFDTKNGKEVEKPEEIYINKNVTVTNSNNTAVIKADGEKIATLKNTKKNPMLQEEYDKGFYFTDDEKLVIFIEK